MDKLITTGTLKFDVLYCHSLDIEPNSYSAKWLDNIYILSLYSELL